MLRTPRTKSHILFFRPGGSLFDPSSTPFFIVFPSSCCLTLEVILIFCSFQASHMVLSSPVLHVGLFLPFFFPLGLAPSPFLNRSPHFFSRPKVCSPPSPAHGVNSKTPLHLCIWKPTSWLFPTFFCTPPPTKCQVFSLSFDLSPLCFSHFLFQ